MGISVGTYYAFPFISKYLLETATGILRLHGNASAGIQVVSFKTPLDFEARTIESTKCMCIGLGLQLVKIIDRHFLKFKHCFLRRLMRIGNRNSVLESTISDIVSMYF
jgi:hypothetical protein